MELRPVTLNVKRRTCALSSAVLRLEALTWPEYYFCVHMPLLDFAKIPERCFQSELDRWGGIFHLKRKIHESVPENP